MEKQYFVYILTSGKYGTLYVGVTNNLIKRMYEHKEKLIAGFTNKYHIHALVYYEIYDDIYMAISREKTNKEMEKTVENKLD